MSSKMIPHFVLFQYLTTVIPYHANQGPPRIDQLQIYIKSKLSLSNIIKKRLIDYLKKIPKGEDR